MQEIRSIRKLQKSSCNIAKGQPCVKKIFDTHGSYGNWVFLVWCVIVIFVDTWFLYIPMVNGDKKCIEFDKDLWIAASAFRSVFDLFYIIDNVFRLHTGISKSSRKRSWLLFLSDVLFILPIPQVMKVYLMNAWCYVYIKDSYHLWTLNCPGVADFSYDSKNERHRIFVCCEILSFPTCA